jgi:hypothetical protein
MWRLTFCKNPKNRKKSVKASHCELHVFFEMPAQKGEQIITYVHVCCIVKVHIGEHTSTMGTYIVPLCKTTLFRFPHFFPIL